MPKMRGFLRSKSKIDEAEWAIAEMRTAARLGDLFTPNGSPPAKTTDETDGAEAAPDLSSIVVGPSPWSGGPRPPIIVLGVSDVVSVLGQGGPTEPADDSTDVPTDPEPVVEEHVSPAAPIGVMAETGLPPLRKRPDEAAPIRVWPRPAGNRSTKRSARRSRSGSPSPRRPGARRSPARPNQPASWAAPVRSSSS